MLHLPDSFLSLQDLQGIGVAAEVDAPAIASAFAADRAGAELGWVRVHE